MCPNLRLRGLRVRFPSASQLLDSRDNLALAFELYLAFLAVRKFVQQHSLLPPSSVLGALVRDNVMYFFLYVMCLTSHSWRELTGDRIGGVMLLNIILYIFTSVRLALVSLSRSTLILMCSLRLPREIQQSRESSPAAPEFKSIVLGQVDLRRRRDWRHASYDEPDASKAPANAHGWRYNWHHIFAACGRARANRSGVSR